MAFSRLSLAVGLIAAFLTQSSTLSFATEALPRKVPGHKRNTRLEKLGAQLYFDTRLSRDNTVSCNSCHNVEGGAAGVDGLPTSKGINQQVGGRNAPTVWNAAFLSTQFWDGRAKTLEDQAKGPITNPIEMGFKNHDLAIARLKKVPGYIKSFKKVFSKQKDPLNIDNVAKAIAAFERTLISPGAPFDRFIKGRKKAISAQARKGWALFQSKGCISCHNGPTFAGPALPIGTGFFMKFPRFEGSDYDEQYELLEDKGREEVTGDRKHRYFWRVPTLRNIADTGPYFHNGKVKTLKEAVKVMARVQLDAAMEDKEVDAVVAFLKTLSGPRRKIKKPKLPPDVKK